MSDAKQAKPFHQFTLNELRGILSDEIDKIRSGNTTASNVNAISNATGKILASVKLELEAVKMMGKKPTNLAAIAGLPEYDPERKDDAAIPEMKTS